MDGSGRQTGKGVHYLLGNEEGFEVLISYWQVPVVADRPTFP